ncbi:MAG: hypothetical protein KDE59_16835, partial [Anaerolineales bacterium]|nr:hypothetical protein [Anaerolineales bacterium]
GQRHEVDRYLAQRDTIIYLELGLAGYALAGVITCLATHNYGPLFFFSACLSGLGYVAWLSLQEQWQERGLRAQRRRRSTATHLSGRFPS